MRCRPLTRAGQRLELPNELLWQPDGKKNAATMEARKHTKAQNSTALLPASASRAGTAEREKRVRSFDITPDELAPA